MKKNVLKVALVAAFCFVAGYTAYNAQSKNENLSDIVLDNVEALAGYPEWMYVEDWYLINVTQNSHTCLPGGYFDCAI